MGQALLFKEQGSPSMKEVRPLFSHPQCRQTLYAQGSIMPFGNEVTLHQVTGELLARKGTCTTIQRTRLGRLNCDSIPVYRQIVEPLGFLGLRQFRQTGRILGEGVDDELTQYECFRCTQLFLGPPGSCPEGESIQRGFNEAVRVNKPLIPSSFNAFQDRAG